MSDEFRNDIPEFNSISENENFQENIVFKENQAFQENENVKETQEYTEVKKSNPSKRRTALSVLSGSLVTVVAGVVAGMTTMLNVNMKASIDTCEYVDSHIEYKVNIDNMTEKESLKAYIYEETKLIETIDLFDDDNDGTIQGIIDVDSNHINELIDESDSKAVRLYFDLRGDVGLNVERKFDRYCIKIEEVISNFEDVNTWCSCGVDGNYNFQMNFIDNAQAFDNFEAYIVDSFGNRSDCTFTSDLHEKQTIKVLPPILKGSSGKLYIKYTRNGELVELDPIDVNF